VAVEARNKPRGFSLSFAESLLTLAALESCDLLPKTGGVFRKETPPASLYSAEFAATITLAGAQQEHIREVTVENGLQTVIMAASTG
jgi:hypothetical protein